MEDTDPDLIDEICGQDENDQNHFERGRRRRWMGRCLGGPMSNIGWSVLYLDVEI